MGKLINHSRVSLSFDDKKGIFENDWSIFTDYGIRITVNINRFWDTILEQISHMKIIIPCTIRPITIEKLSFSYAKMIYMLKNRAPEFDSDFSAKSANNVNRPLGE